MEHYFKFEITEDLQRTKFASTNFKGHFAIW
jgi:hypothetical protein